MSASIRLNVTVPQDVAQTLKEMAGPREQSSFIAESVRHYAKLLRRKKLHEEMKEGYLASHAEGEELSKEFDTTLMDGLTDEDF